MAMNDQYLSKVGSKGELFPPKKLRKKLGLEAGRKIIYYIYNGKLIVEPIPTVKSILSENLKLINISKQEIEEDRKQIIKEAET